MGRLDLPDKHRDEDGPSDREMEAWLERRERRRQYVTVFVGELEDLREASAERKALRARLDAARALLERADYLIAADTEMVVCWHEYEDPIKSECVQCCVEAALAALNT